MFPWTWEGSSPFHNLGEGAFIALTGTSVVLATNSSPWPWNPTLWRKSRVKMLQGGERAKLDPLPLLHNNVFRSSPIFCIGLKTVSRKGKPAKGNGCRVEQGPGNAASTPCTGLNVDRRRWLWPKPVTWAQRLCFGTEVRAHPCLTSTPWPVGLLHGYVPKTQHSASPR